YYEVEKLFCGRNTRDEDSILKLREENKDDIMSVIRTVLSHSRIGSKNNLILAILAMYRPNQPNVGNVGKHFKPILKKFTEIESRAAAKVSLKAREVLI
ncbi:acetyl-CoA carboxylase, partial [Aspergillus sclerotialis]